MGSQPRPPLEPVADRRAVTRTNPLHEAVARAGALGGAAAEARRHAREQLVEVTTGEVDRLELAEQVDAANAEAVTPPPRRLSRDAVAAWVGLTLLAAAG